MAYKLTTKVIDLVEKMRAYQELLEVALKNKEYIDPNIVAGIKEDFDTVQKSMEFGLELSYAGYNHYAVEGAYDKWTRVLFIPKDADHFIGCSDNGKQPQDEWLYIICFPTGPYIFGNYFNDCYPKETFDEFFSKLKGFEPKYCDSVNKALYFTADKAKAAHEAFQPLFNKYKALVKDEMERKRIKELEQELAKLKEKTND